jgi:hypothetical protein
MSIFQVGDRVFYHRFGWGEITYITVDILYPIIVYFDNTITEYFTIDGCLDIDHKYPSLSFTEYNFITGGFSQLRPRPDLKSGLLECPVKS